MPRLLAGASAIHATHRDGPLASSARAAPRRLSASSRPSSAALSNRPGATVRPVSGDPDRRECRLRLQLELVAERAQRLLDRARRRTRRAPRGAVRPRRAPRRRAGWRAAARGPRARSATGPKRKPQYCSNSASVAIFSCTSGVASAITLGLRRERRPGLAQEPTRRSPSASCESARMCTPFIQSSFWWSKTAGAAFTRSSEKSPESSSSENSSRSPSRLQPSRAR